MVFDNVRGNGLWTVWRVMKLFFNFSCLFRLSCSLFCYQILINFTIIISIPFIIINISIRRKGVPKTHNLLLLYFYITKFSSSRILLCSRAAGRVWFYRESEEDDYRKRRHWRWRENLPNKKLYSKFAPLFNPYESPKFNLRDWWQHLT